MISPSRSLCTALAALALFAPAGFNATAGTYSQTFTKADGVTGLGDGSSVASSNTTNSQPTASVQGNALRLTSVLTSLTRAAYRLPVMDSGKSIDSFDVAFQLRLGGTSPVAEGFSLNYGAVPNAPEYGNGETGFSMPNGLTIGWDTYNTANVDPPSIEVFANGVSVGNFPQTFPIDDVSRPVVIHWDTEGLDITVDGVVICSNLPTPGFIPVSGNRFAFSARTGSSFKEDLFIDDLTVNTGFLDFGGPIISEFVVDNTDLEDEDFDTPGWIEIYNAQNAVLDLTGWHLTDSSAEPARWTFPAMTVPAYAYRVLYASGKNRTVATQPLHTNFILQKTGGYLALTRPDNSVASDFTYGQQVENVSFGEKGSARTVGFMYPPSPGTNNRSLQAAGPPAEKVVWSVPDGGLLTAANDVRTVTIAAPQAPGTVIRYTIDTSEPNEASPVYDPATPPAVFTVATTTSLRARAFTPGRLPGPVSSRTFLKLDASNNNSLSLTNYNGSNQIFSSHLPVVVLDSFGVNVDGTTDPAQIRPFRNTYSVVIDKDPATGRASLNGPIQFQGRSGNHVRGESSSGFPQKQYTWELRDEEDQDINAPLLGMPSGSDWVLHAPYTDKSLMRNFLVYSRMFALRGEGSAMRGRFCEVFFNQRKNQPVSKASYLGVYVLLEKIKRGKDRVEIAKLNSLVTDPVKITGGYIFKKDKGGVGNTAWSTLKGVPLQSQDPEVLNTAQKAYLTKYINDFETALYGPNAADPVVGYQAYLDRDTMIDNQWWVEISKQIDGYRISNYFYKDRGDRIKNLPLWDYNLSLFNADYLAGDQPAGWYYPQVGFPDYFWYPQLHAEPNYEMRHWDRYWELRKKIFATTGPLDVNVLAQIDANAATLLNGGPGNVGNNAPLLPPADENAVMRHYRKWQILGTYIWPNPNTPVSGPMGDLGPVAARNTYQKEIDAMKRFLTLRLAWIDDQNFRPGTKVIYRPPIFSNNGGSVPSGAQVTIDPYTGTPPATYSYASGTIYYTTDGTDPRLQGGAVSPTATVYAGPITVSGPMVINARLLNGTIWSPYAVAEFTVDTVPASAANIVVSELMYHPQGATAAEAAAGYGESDFEFVELLNIGTQNVDLTGCDLLDAVNFDFDAADPATRTLAPGGRLVVVGNLSGFAARYAGDPARKIAGVFSGSLSNGGELFTLRAADTSIIAQFTWSDLNTWPAGADGGGYSLVLDGPAANPNYGLGESWMTSAQIGGTPGMPNGALFTGSMTADTDSDGYRDFLEFATGSNPTDPNSIFAPVIEWVIDPAGLPAGSYLQFRYRRNLAAAGPRYAVETSPDLVNWSSARDAVTFVGSLNNGDGTATVTVRTAQPAVPGQPQRWMRLKVTP